MKKSVIIRPSLLAVRKLIPTFSKWQGILCLQSDFPVFHRFWCQIRNINKKVGKKPTKPNILKHIWRGDGVMVAQVVPKPSSKRIGMVQMKGFTLHQVARCYRYPPHSRKMNVCPEKGSCRVSAKFIFQSSIFRKIYTANVDLAILILFLCCFRIFLF